MAVMARESWTDERLDHLNERMDERFDRVDADMKAGFARVDERFKQVDKEMKAGFARVDAEMKLRFNQVDQRLDRMGGDMSELRAALEDLHDDNKEMQRTITQATISICAVMVGGFAAIVAALIGAGAF